MQVCKSMTEGGFGQSLCLLWVHEVVESQPRLFSERMRLFVCDTCIYLAIFTDTICASSVINLTHTATQEQSEASSASTPIRLATQQSLHCPPPLWVTLDAGLQKKCTAFPCNFLITVQSFHCGRSIDQFRLSLVHIWAEEQRAFHDTATLQISIEFAIQSHEARDGGTGARAVVPFGFIFYCKNSGLHLTFTFSWMNSGSLGF